MSPTSENKVIWWFNHYAVSPDDPGGTRHYEIARALKRHTFSSFIIASNFNHFSFQKTHNEGLEELEDKVNFIWIDTPAYKRSNAISRLINMLTFSFKAPKVISNLQKKKVLPNPNVIIGSTVHPFAAMTASKLARKLRVPFVYEVRDLWPHSLIVSGKLTQGNPIALLLEKLNRRLTESSEMIIVLSPETKDYFTQELKVPEHKVFLFPNLIDMDEAKKTAEKTPLPSQFKRELQRFKSFFKIGYTGSLSFFHATDVLLSAIRRLPNNIVLFLIGDGGMRKELENQLKTLREKRVVILGPYPRKVVWRITKEFDALILIDRNLAWGSSNKLVDYLIGEKPIIFVAGSTQNSVESLGVRANLDPDDIAGKINYLMDNYEKIFQKAKKVLDKTLRRFDIKSKAKELGERFQEIIGREG